MNNEFEKLQGLWQQNRKDIENSPLDLDKAIADINTKKRFSTKFHYGNIIVLSLLVVMLIAFFYFLAPVQEILSRIGVGLMIGGIVVRILIEAISVSKAKKIDMVDNAIKNTEDTIAFHDYRKRIHGPVTIVIIILYSIGFYMISPEFSKYFDTWQMILMDVSYIFIAIILIFFIRKSVIKEMKTLSEIIELKKEMIKEEV
ncbi:hypothetical protein [Aquimarina sp. MMG016]|uniref:hypothetical protein n=1 Tax=Aquimarina sp. MMG016 TaxID=2822690 RepID=UPI001B3A70B4|nr:hypothetical protein [Aquimarina sp. MMG016]MBQ4822114.1 hypothetical protein [Aquimarina sp. MMG016]